MTEQAKKYLAKKKLEKMEWHNAIFGLSIGGIVIALLTCIFFMLIVNINHANAGELDNWEFNIMGINPRDFKDREVLPIIGGAILSLGVHELGHFAVGEMYGGGSSFDWGERAVMVSDYHQMSNDERALFHGAGFLAQTLVGGILTAIPKTRHSDWTFGFNAFSSVNSFGYGITGGFGDENKSDVHNLDRYGYNGTAIAIGSGVVNGVFTYISLNKDKEE